jgi:hypothetical protein
MNRQIRRILKVYVRLGWLILHDYYEKLTSVAYAGVQAINSFRNLTFLKQLWQQVPDPLAIGYYDDCKKRLQDLWEYDYKHREPNGRRSADVPDGDSDPNPPA